MQLQVKWHCHAVAMEMDMRMQWQWQWRDRQFSESKSRKLREVIRCLKWWESVRKRHTGKECKKSKKMKKVIIVEGSHED